MNINTRKNIYSLLLSRPLFNYVVKRDGKYNINVLIAGFDEDCVEAFKAVYWCGQLTTKYNLTISILSPSVEEFKSSIKEQMPAIESSAVFANILYLEDDNNFDFAKYTYCFISKKYAHLLEHANNGKIDSLICLLFEQPTSDLDNENMIYLANEDLFKEEIDLLDLYAFNCDYAYRMGENERCVKGELSDFVKPSGSNDYYNYLSSLSFPVHIPYKMHICAEEQQNDINPVQALLNAIREKDYLYNTLLETEHRRWTAYMISEGWRMPTDEELHSYAFSNFGYAGGYDQRDKKLLLHPCICIGSTDGCKIDKYSEIWRVIEMSDLRTYEQIKSHLEGNYPDEDFSDLEVITLELYGIVCDRAKEAYPKVKALFHFMDHLEQGNSKVVYDCLKQSVNKLANDELNSSKVFAETLIEAKKCAESDDLQYEISAVESAMKIFVEKNKKKNYFTIDSTMIDMIPFCIWYGRENRTIITISAGLPLEDVITPTILCAETAIFIEEEPSLHYEDAITNYFNKSRRNNTKVVFYSCNLNNQDEIVSLLKELTERYDTPSINCVSGNTAATNMSIGALADSCNIPVFSYSYASGIQNIKNGDLISPGLNKKTLSVDEMVLLMGGNYTNMFSKVPYISQLNELEKIFRKYYDEQTYYVDGKRKTFSAWAALSTLFQSASKNQSPEIVGEYKRSHLNTCINKEIFSTCGLQFFLPLLNEYCIIRNYKVENDKDDSKSFVNVCFDYYDSGILYLITPYTTECCCSASAIELRKKERLTFTTTSGISLMSLIAENAQLSNPGEHDEMTATKIRFMEELESKGFIHSLKISADNSVASLEFYNFVIKNIFKNQGKLFELLLYYKIRNSGLFDDVQTGVKIAWTPVIQSRDEAIREYLKSSGKYGYNIFMKAKREIDAERRNVSFSTSTDNEIDIVMTSGMSPIFVSCKVSKNGGNEWLYEIASIASHFMARPVLAITKNLDTEASNILLSRARMMNISVIGYETVFDNDRLSYALDCISKGIVVMGPETIQ